MKHLRCRGAGHGEGVLGVRHHTEAEEESALREMNQGSLAVADLVCYLAEVDLILA